MFLAAWLILAFLFAMQEYLGLRSTNYKILLSSEIIGWSLHFLLWGVVTQLLWSYFWDRIQSVSGWKLLTRLLPISICVSIMQEVIYVATFPLFITPLRSWTYLERLSYFLRAELVTNIAIFWTIFLLFRGVGYYQKYREREMASSRLETQLVSAQLRALRMQLNPHFLFNTMNGISSLMRSDVEAADEMLERLSRLLRMTLDRGDSLQVRLEEEMDFVTTYLSIQAMRFGPRLRYDVNVSSDVLECTVPTMILQPVVENAYVHGISRCPEGGYLCIEARRQDQHLMFRVRNTGRGLETLQADGPAREGIGIANIRARLELHYGTEQSFTLREIAGGEVEAIILLPFDTSLASKHEPTPRSAYDSGGGCR